MLPCSHSLSFHVLITHLNKRICMHASAGIALFDITPQIRARVKQLGVKEGFVNVLSRHTTTAIAINEYETRLLDDIRQVRGLQGLVREKAACGLAGTACCRAAVAATHSS